MRPSDQVAHQGKEPDEAKGCAEQEEEDTKEGDAGVEEGKVVTVDIEQLLHSGLVSVNAEGKDVHDTNNHGTEEKQGDKCLFGSRHESSSGSCKPFTLAEEVGKGEKEEKGNIGEGEDKVPNALDEARIQPLDVPGAGVMVEDFVADG